MRLRETLEGIREKSAARLPDDAKEVMRRAIRQLDASGQVEKAIGSGAKMPPFALQDHLGELYRSEDFLSEGPLVLQFYRGYWWPYCNAELEALQNSHEGFREAGARLVAISPMVAEYSQKMIAKHELTFPVLLDPGNRVAERFGLRYALPEDLKRLYAKLEIDLPRFNGDESWALPIPARYVVSREGEVVASAVSADYRERPNPEETLGIVCSL